MRDDDTEARLRAEAEREGERLFTPEIQQMLARELQEAKRLVATDDTPAHPNSAQLYAEALRVIPGGVNSPVRAFRHSG